MSDETKQPQSVGRGPEPASPCDDRDALKAERQPARDVAHHLAETINMIQLAARSSIRCGAEVGRLHDILDCIEGRYPDGASKAAESYIGSSLSAKLKAENADLNRQLVTMRSELEQVKRERDGQYLHVLPEAERGYFPREFKTTVTPLGLAQSKAELGGDNGDA